jgi:hypothetical protein
MLFNLKKDQVFYARKLLCPSVMACLIAIVLLSTVSFNTIAVVAQIPTIPSLPTEEEDEENDNLELSVDNSIPTNNTSSIPPPTIAITSLEDGQEVPSGQLTINGISSDDADSDCQVYADVNDIAPLQNATATGPNGEDDFSQWTFAYTKDYRLITEGANELTAKISCFSGGNPAPMSEWQSVNVTGVATTDEPTMDEGATSNEDEASLNADEGEGGILEGIPGVPPSG